MKKTIIINTGGTISMAADPESGAVKPQDKHPLQDLLPHLQLGDEIEMIDFLHVPSPHMTPQLMLSLANRIEHELANDDVHGIVVTHGTDTLEETAYLLDLVLSSPKPVVVTGAMHSSNELGADGPLNLVQAIHVATTPASNGRGTLVVFNGEIHAARHVQKIHTSSTAAFASEIGPIGAITQTHVHYWHEETRKPNTLSAKQLQVNVPLLKATAGMSNDWISFLLEPHIDGVVIEAFGTGNVPPDIVPTLKELIRQGKPVVLVSRCPHGLVQALYDYEGGGAQLNQFGVIFAKGLSGPKARLKLMLALATEQQIDRLANLF